jgi:hypothetical protein
MHLHDRHGAHLTLPAPLKQARQSLLRGSIGVLAAGFPYTSSEDANPWDSARNFVSIPLHAVTKLCQIRHNCRTTAH